MKNKSRRTARKKALKPLVEKEEYKEIKENTTDPEGGVFHKGEHKKVFAYLANVAFDKNNYVMGFVLNSGNKHDSKEFPKLYEQLKNRFKNIKNVVVDAGYKTPAIAKQILDDYKTIVTPYKRPMTKFGFFKKYEFVYDEYYDVYICPNNEFLKYSTTNRDGYKEYKSNKIKCQNCEYLSKCTQKTDEKVEKKEPNKRQKAKCGITQ